MVPVDMRGVEQQFVDLEEMVEKLGPKGVAEASLKAQVYHDENKGSEPDDERPKPMTAKERRDVLNDDDFVFFENLEEELEGEEELAELDRLGLLESDPDEDLEGEEESDPDLDSAEESVYSIEPVAKKTKTDE